jgi:tetratricopeptide (TPR) repeat protein
MPNERFNTSIRAGDHAAAHYAHIEAAEHYQTALDLLLRQSEEVEAAEVRCRMATELDNLNRPDSAMAIYEAALETYEHVGDRARQAQVHLGIAWVHQLRYDLTNALPHLDLALRLWPPEREGREFAIMLLDIARAKLFNGHTATASVMAERGLALATGLGDPALQARALVEVAISHWHNASAATVIELLDRAEPLARIARDWPTLRRVHMNRSAQQARLGDLERYWADSKRALDLAELTAAPERIVSAVLNHVEASHLRGMWVEGRDAAHKHSLAQAPPHSSLLLVAVMEGDFERALDMFGELYTTATSRGDLQQRLLLLTNRAAIALDTGWVEVAAAAAREAVDLGRSGELAWSWMTYGQLTEAVVRLGSEESEAILNQAESIAANHQVHGMDAQLHRARGILLQQRGNLHGAISILQTSATLARSQHAVLELGRTLAVLEDVARARGDAALAASANNERVAIIGQIGPEVRELVWASNAAGVGDV